MARGERLVVAAVRPPAVCREFQGLDQQLADGLRAEQVHADVRHLRLVEQAPERVGPDRQRHLFGCIAVILAGSEEVVDRRVVAAQVRVDGLIGGMNGQGEASSSERQIRILP
jgi:hypothetical protein